MRSAPILAAGVAALGVAAAVGNGAEAAAKQPPACAALTFRPIPSGLTDGEHGAGLYKSRFGRIELVAVVKNGKAESYVVEVNGKPPTPATGALPASVAACAKAKRLGPIGKPPAACLGDRFAVLVDHTGEQRYVLLYAQQGGEWRFCSVGST